ncbi:amino acid permease-domain-containing protein [Xylogone sp. PMI_703]|nr:amino acid permease-domain-containing protein [Xylogone sp. PMI_703]
MDLLRRRSSSGKGVTNTTAIGDDDRRAPRASDDAESKRANGRETHPKRGLVPRPVGGTHKLGMFSGVYVPTCLNILSILMFLRFGFVLGQAGVLGMMGMLIASYVINAFTTFSLSAIASNGTVRGGGAYYLISRSLGPEFGGSIGIVFYMGLVFNTGLNAVGLIDCVKLNFGAVSGNWYHVMPEGQWDLYLWSTVVLLTCTLICLAGSAIFVRASNGLLIILVVSTLSIPLSALILSPFEDRELGIEYTGLSLETFTGNLKPQLTRGAAGSQLPGKETFQDLFGILFPATSGIFAGASMSGDLRNPSKSIPKGTLYGLYTTFTAYTLVILSLAATITRSSFLRNANIIQDTNISAVLILAGEFASSFFSTLMGVIGSAKLLQALGRDNLLPGFSVFGQGTKNGDEPTYAILITYVVAQGVMLCNLNQIASFVTMAYLMTFLVMNLACFLLKIGSAPNFRPSFHFFNWQTAFLGTILSGGAMFFVDGFYASGCVGILVVIFLIIHYTSPPKSWGDVSQSLIYHQVRKYLLRLRQEHVKFWRPQILLFINDARRQRTLIQFCNSMKKGGLYILGHVIVTDDFGGSVPEARRQQTAWAKFIDYSKIKAFVNVTIAPAVEWGVRNIVLSAGLGGMRPNIAVLGFYNLDDLRRSKPLVDVQDSEPRKPDVGEPDAVLETLSAAGERSPSFEEPLPTDLCKTEAMMSATSYVTILEDLLLRLQINVAVARGFQDLELPNPKGNNSKKYIDLWPIQMSAEIAAGDNKNVLTTNFDTYTLILQLGVILNTVPAWKTAYKLRVAVFVEYESDVEEERGRVKTLLEKLRIEAEVLVFWLASGDLPTYEVIVNGAASSKEDEEKVESCLKDQEWWDEIQRYRGKRGPPTATDDLANIFTSGSNWPEAAYQQGHQEEKVQRFAGLRKLLITRRRHTMSGISKLGVNLNMQAQRLPPDLVGHHSSRISDDSGVSDDSDESDSEAIIDSDSEGPASVVSEADIDEYQVGNNGNQQPPPLRKLVRRRKTFDESIARLPPLERDSSKKRESQTKTPSTSQSREPLAKSRPEGLIRSLSEYQLERENASERPTSSVSNRSDLMSPGRPPLARHTSQPKFTSKPVPITRVATEDGPGPSIMFADTPSPPARRDNRLPSAYRNKSYVPDDVTEVPEEDTQSHRGSTYSTQSIPLSFNDLPCRAQHLILNELMQQQSSETAVLFTTLPSPAEGTCLSVEASTTYLSDLEVLCKGCPPMLMVHSNSMTVTISL